MSDERSEESKRRSRGVADVHQNDRMAILDHLGITIDDLPRSIAQFHPILDGLGFTRYDADNGVSWHREGEFELILFPAREPATGPHRHGRVGWQHLAFACASREEVDRMHSVALEAGWTAVREPKLYPRYNDRYYASFVEEDNGIRFEFMFNPADESGGTTS